MSFFELRTKCLTRDTEKNTPAAPRTQFKNDDNDERMHQRHLLYVSGSCSSCNFDYFLVLDTDLWIQFNGFLQTPPRPLACGRANGRTNCRSAGPQVASPCASIEFMYLHKLWECIYRQSGKDEQSHLKCNEAHIFLRSKGPLPTIGWVAEKPRTLENQYLPLKLCRLFTPPPTPKLVAAAYF